MCFDTILATCYYSIICYTAGASFILAKTVQIFILLYLDMKNCCYYYFQSTYGFETLMARKELKPNIKTTTPIVEILTYFTVIRFGIHRTHWNVRCRNEIFVLVKNAKTILYLEFQEYLKKYYHTRLNVNLTTYNPIHILYFPKFSVLFKNAVISYI